ncbi:hypothetical protein [Christiangramia sabulilitoris]|uniref:Uncharacterized protein n=1 Tax=Christiangramia sabulilitoris TaxID=2583991 RepID=A0A550HZW8_9FLAO|nr:hypothetical protein [Christiangramia sabulilitoris]TRO64118.1 hypothetical protein FGM01_11465 [Christiangramia sabulilitoris]
MRTVEKKRTIELLEKLRVFNKKSAYIYKITMEREKRLLLKNMYYKLYEQKVKFLEEIEDTIEQLKKEISPLKDPKLLSFYQRRKCILGKNYLKYKLRLRFADIQKRELKGFEKYQKYLSKTSHACVRELFLDHKHKIKENLNQMQVSSVMKFPIA